MAHHENGGIEPAVTNPEADQERPRHQLLGRQVGPRIFLSSGVSNSYGCSGRDVDGYSTAQRRERLDKGSGERVPSVL